MQILPTIQEENDWVMKWEMIVQLVNFHLSKLSIAKFSILQLSIAKFHSWNLG